MEPEFTKAKNEMFGEWSEDKLTTRDVGLDKEEETEEAMILTSLGVHNESMQLSRIDLGGVFKRITGVKVFGIWYKPVNKIKQV